MGTLWAQLFLQFSTSCFEILQMFFAWNEDMHMVWVQYFEYFFALFLLCELKSFLTWNAIKVYSQWVPCVRNSSYSFPLNVLKLFRCFLHGMKMCMWFGYNPLIFFFSLFLLCELSLFLIWNASKVYRQWVPCWHNTSYSFSPIVWKH